MFILCSRVLPFVQLTFFVCDVGTPESTTQK